jgi:sn-glycerol 3-phosphate transport system permease protein
MVMLRCQVLAGKETGPMVERRRSLLLVSHLVLIGGVLLVALPIWIAFVASTHEPRALYQRPMPVTPGEQLLANYGQVLGEGVRAAGAAPVSTMMLNSLVMALGIAVGKITISILSAFAIVYFRFPFRMLCFWTIFVTLMLPVEVRILPTYEVVAGFGMLDSYAGLIVPLIASATATFLFRQFFLTVPDELTEAARIDGAGPLKFFWDILLPLSKTNIAALFVILFIYGWNQYLWPLLVTTSASMYTVVMGIKRMVEVADAQPYWHLVMAVTILAMLPPVVVVLLMQRWFVKGLVDTEK